MMVLPVRRVVAQGISVEPRATSQLIIPALGWGYKPPNFQEAQAFMKAASWKKGGTPKVSEAFGVPCEQSRSIFSARSTISAVKPPSKIKIPQKIPISP
jgi:hypothetical protein